jgi:hypothetical protein
MVKNIHIAFTLQVCRYLDLIDIVGSGLWYLILSENPVKGHDFGAQEQDEHFDGTRVATTPRSAWYLTNHCNSF